MSVPNGILHPEPLHSMIERIVRNFDPLRIILFGSRATDLARPDSDYDLLIVLPKVENKRQTTIQIRRALNGSLASKDIIVTTPDEIAIKGNTLGLVLRPALRTGKVVYERD
jgi:uncharacterized protein